VGWGLSGSCLYEEARTVLRPVSTFFSAVDAMVVRLHSLTPCIIWLLGAGGLPVVVLQQDQREQQQVLLQVLRRVGCPFGVLLLGVSLKLETPRRSSVTPQPCLHT
jgi:hypothetical protein